MGAWGTGLYQDDVTCDIKDDYLNRLRVGYTNIEATNELIDYYMDSIEDEEEGPLFWFALADVQWRYGRLLPEVKNEALRHIKNGTDLVRWQYNKKQYEKRKFVLEELEKRLNSPVPAEKKLSKLIIKKALWEVGDVLIYKIHNGELAGNEMVRDSKWYNKFIALRIIGIDRCNIGSLPREYSNEYSVAGIYNWVGDTEPTFETFKKLKLLSKKEKTIMRILPTIKSELTRLDIKDILKNIGYNDNLTPVNNGQGIIWLNSNYRL